MANRPLTSQLAGIVGRTLGRVSRRTLGRVSRRTLGRVSAGHPAPPAYSGDFRGTPEIRYEPNPGNGDVADPGEIVWAWVPFEEDHSQGKDRPVLVIGRDGPWLLALPMTSKDHDRDAVQEAHDGRHWADIGSGDWDPRGRASEVRVDRILRVDPAGVRRVGAVLDEGHFRQVAAAVRRPAP